LDLAGAGLAVASLGGKNGAEKPLLKARGGRSCPIDEPPSLVTASPHRRVLSGGGCRARLTSACRGPYDRTMATTREAFVVVDLGFGDAGKGTVTDHLVRRFGAHTVVRFNGGAQAGHNVVTPDGRHHTFAQFGAGTFSEGVRTVLAPPVVVHPTALLAEARWLERAGVRDPLARVSVSASCKVVTPFHQAASRLRELARGDARHGSCGVGVGEVMLDDVTHGERLRAGELLDAARLRRSLAQVQARKRAALDDAVRALRGDARAAPEVHALESPAVIDRWVEALAPWRARGLGADDDALPAALAAAGRVVFEGAQGVLLDEWRGFHPHTTWSTCTFDNALDALRGYDGAVHRVGVTRCYATRHGAGPFPTEDAALTRALDEPHNPTGAWQGAFRAGWPDAALLRYALAVCGGVDGLAVTHLDRLGGVARWRGCVGYKGEAPWFTPAGALVPGGPRDLAWQEALGRALTAASPVYEDLGEVASPAAYVAWLEGAVGAPVWITSEGPRDGDKRVVGAVAAASRT
jgi:adenylosuccinate synthase